MPRGRRHTHEEFRFCVQIVFLHFNFLVLTLKSRCCFVYDIFAIVRMPLWCNVLECFTALELEAVIAAKDFLDLHW